MGFRRRTFRRRSYRRKRVYRRRPYKKMARIAKAVVKHSKVWKCDDIYFNNQGFTTTGVGAWISMPRTAINGGSFGEEDSRVSNKIRFQRIKYDYYVTAGTNNSFVAADVYNNFRMLIVQVLEATPNTATTLTTLSSRNTLFQGGTATVATDMLRARFDGAYRILAQRKGVVYQRATQGSTADNGVTQVHLQGSVNCKRVKPQRYSDNTDQPLYGAIFVIFWSDSAVPPNPIVNGTLRAWYTDD